MQALRISSTALWWAGSSLTRYKDEAANSQVLLFHVAEGKGQSPTDSIEVAPRALQ